MLTCSQGEQLIACHGLQTHVATEAAEDTLSLVGIVGEETTQ